MPGRGRNIRNKNEEKSRGMSHTWRSSDRILKSSKFRGESIRRIINFYDSFDFYFGNDRDTALNIFNLDIFLFMTHYLNDDVILWSTEVMSHMSNSESF